MADGGVPLATTPPFSAISSLAESNHSFLSIRIAGTSRFGHRYSREPSGEKAMNRILAGTSLALFLVASSAGAVFASDWTILDRVVQQRIDTEEVTLPPPPDGPSTPVPFCSPAAPICP